MEQYGLIIKKEWLDRILDGSKFWELRSRNTSKRGRVLLIESGSGLIRGCTNLVDTIRLDEQSYYANHDKHLVDLPFSECRWTSYAYVLDSVTRFQSPYRYTHPKGAVVWVRLNANIVPDFDKLLKELEVINIAE